MRKTTLLVLMVMLPWFIAAQTKILTIEEATGMNRKLFPASLSHEATAPWSTGSAGELFPFPVMTRIAFCPRLYAPETNFPKLTRASSLVRPWRSSSRSMRIDPDFSCFKRFAACR